MLQENWSKFEQTGSVLDYLCYAVACEREEDIPMFSGGRQEDGFRNERGHSCDGYGAAHHADR